MEHLEELKVCVRKLNNLLQNSEAGLVAWHKFVSMRWKEIADLYVSQLTIETNAKEPLYYMQDRRQYVGNSMYWWAKDARGYVCDIKKAHIFTLDEAIKHTHRDTDILWPKDYIDDRIQHHIDFQYCDHKSCNTISMDLAKTHK